MDEVEDDDDHSGREDRRQELAEYRRRMEGAMLAGDVAWWEMDVETGATEFGDRKARMLGYDPDRFDHYEDFTELIHPGDYEGAMEAMRDHLEGRADKYDAEYRIETADGEYRWFHDVGGVTERADDGTPQKATGIVVDVTRRKQVEERLRRQNDQLVLLNRIVRHDIRNDMEVVVGWLDHLAGVVDEDVSEEVGRIREASQHVIELTKSVRHLTTLIEEGDDLDLEPVDLGAVLETQVERIRSDAPGASVELHGRRDVAVAADAMLPSVFRNLLNNAVQHAGDAPEIVVAVEDREDGVEVRVTDDGPGIPDERKTAVFGRGEGLDDTDASSGVGLYLVETLVEAYGGEVWVTDADPTGAVFHVELPTVDAGDDGEARTPDPGNGG